MRIYCLQHVSFEEPAAIADWARFRSNQCFVVHLYRGEGLPRVEDFDALVVMGGPMSVNDERQYQWLGPEKRLIRVAMDAGQPVLGVCLGAQLIAAALRQRVYPGPEKEIGWFPVRRVTTAGIGAMLPEVFTPLHWHGETFDLPAGAVRLAETGPVPNQAFQWGEHVVGLQFHIETTPASVAQLVQNAGHEIGRGRYQQPPEDILDCAARCDAVRPILFSLLDRLFSGA